MTTAARPTDPTLWSATEAMNPKVNAVCRLAVEPARLLAKAADAATARGESTGPLHGLSVTIKDALETAGIVSTGGAAALRDYVPTADAPAVAAIRHQGAIVFGKTNLPEWSVDLQTYGELFGTTNNPWDLTRTPGGSSGGAAAAVATGMTSFEIGTDIGGSVRVPAAYCGVFGHKPSHGIIPTLGYLDAAGGGTTELDVNVFGPMTRSAGDLALLLDVLAGPTPARSAAWRLELPRSTVSTLKGLRVAAWFDEPAIEIDDEMRSILHGVASVMSGAGALVDDAARPDIDVYAAWTEGARLISAALAVGRDEDVAPNVARLTHHEWHLIDRRRAARRLAWDALFRDFDVVLAPVTCLPPFEHLQSGTWDDRMIDINGHPARYVQLEAWPALIGSALLPSTSTPVGRTAGGLPIGMQVIAPYLHDHTAIAVAGLITELVGGYTPPPIVG
jgi:amidase